MTTAILLILAVIFLAVCPPIGLGSSLILGYFIIRDLGRKD